MRAALLIFLGGGLGSLSRYFINRWLSSLIISPFPYGTLVVNITGCFLIGFLVYYTERFGTNAVVWRLFLVTGLCGGYTTFSSFSFENVQMITNHQVFNVIAYIFFSVAVGMLATFAGIMVARNI